MVFSWLFAMIPVLIGCQKLFITSVCVCEVNLLCADMVDKVDTGECISIHGLHGGEANV